MKKIIIILIITTSLCFAQSKSLPELYASAMTNDGNDIFLFGGLADDPSGSILKINNPMPLLANDLWKYMPKINVWELQNPSDKVKPGERYYHSMGSNSNSVYIFGGYNGKDLLSDIHIFNLATKKWNKVNQPSTLSERMKYGFVQTDNGFYVIGGATPSDQPIKENWHYNINTNTWTRKNDVPFTDTHINAATKVSSDKIIVFKQGGIDKLYIYNEVTDTWREQTTTGQIPKERYNGICVSDGKKVYVGGGYVPTDGRSKDFYELDTDSWVWKKLMDLPKELDGPASTAMNERIYVYGGIDKELKKSNQFYVYDIIQNTWKTETTEIQTKPEAPINLTAVENNKKEVELRWEDKSTNEDGFIVERKKQSENQWSEIGRTNKNETTYIDKNTEGSTNYEYRVAAYNVIGISDYSNIVSLITTEVEEEKIPTEYVLYQNYPNPFNPATTIKYSIPAYRAHHDNVTSSLSRSDQLVILKVYDVLGNEVATLVNAEQPAGSYEVKFDGSKLTSGIYVYRLKYGNYNQFKKFVLIK